MKDDPDKAERAHPVERTIVEMAMSAMVTAVEAGNGVPEAKALARAAATLHIASNELWLRQHLGPADEVPLGRDA